jgi:predicted unusual protein kinase regulating ubiquinone biosynthesis (AarF/ABC1/UbiB family)
MLGPKMASQRKLPEGRLSRLALLASVGAKTGISLLTKSGSEAAAERTAEVLGRMRGLAAKVGQIASYVDGIIPEANREVYEKALAGLRDSAMTSSFAEMKSSIESELGQPLEDLYETFEEQPFASASIGQVHRATLKGGREVAVKVQHPGIQRAVESDLKSAGMLEPLAAMAAGRKVDSKAVFEEMATRLREELDYALEAKRQQRFREIHAGDEKIRVPEVIVSHSSARVLTSELVKGASLDEIAMRSEEERRAFAETMWRFVFKGNLVGGIFNADPHPGNYLFAEDGVVTFLDFGCCEPIEGERQKGARGLHQAALDRDEAVFAKYAKLLLQTRGGEWEKLAVAYSRLCFQPLFASPFHITRPYAASLVHELKSMGKRARKLPKGEFVPVPKGMVFMNRLQFGFYSVLAKLDVEVDYAEIERRFLREAGVS